MEVDWSEIDEETAALLREMLSGMTDEERAAIAAAESEIKGRSSETEELGISSDKSKMDGSEEEFYSGVSSVVSGLPPTINESIRSRIREERTSLLRSMADDPSCADVAIHIYREDHARDGAEHIPLDIQLGNRALLSCVSPLWLEQLANMKPSFSKDQPFILQVWGVEDPSLMTIIIRHSYLLQPRIPVKKLFELRELSERLRIVGLVEQCDEMVSDRELKPTNVCEILGTAVANGMASLVRTCLAKIESDFKAKQFQMMFESESFLTLDTRALIELLKCNTLGVTEEELFRYLLTWAETQAELAYQDYVELEKARMRRKSLDSSSGVSKMLIATDSLIGTILPIDSPDLTGVKKAVDFLSEIKHLIRFASMSVPFLLRNVNDTGLLTMTEEYVLMRLAAAPELMDKPVPLTMEELRKFEQSLKDSKRDDDLDSKEKDSLDDTTVKSDDESYDDMIKPSLSIPLIMERRKGAISIESAHCFRRSEDTSSGSFSYADAMDAVCISVDRDGCTLVGVGILGSPPMVNVYMIVYSPDNDFSSEVVSMEAMQSLEMMDKNAEPIPFVFEFPLELDAGKKYCLELHQNNVGGGNSFNCKRCRSVISVTENEDGTGRKVTLTVSKAANSPNGTTLTSGAFPCFYLCF